MNNDDFLEYFYEVTINSLVFSDNLDEDLKIYFNNYTKKEILILLEKFKYFLDQNKNEKIFDGFVKNNIYKMITFFCDKVEYKEEINHVKIYLNNQTENNCDFLRSQILLRDYASTKFENLKMYIKLKFIDDDVICENKKEYYSSIKYDMLFLMLLIMKDNLFYDFDYNVDEFNKSFYRSLNYFIKVKPDILKNFKNLERIKYIMDCDTSNLERVFNEYSDDFSEDFYEYIDIRNVTLNKMQKFLKKNI